MIGEEGDSPLVRRLYPYFGDRGQGSGARSFIFENGLGARFSPGTAGALASCPSPFMTIRSGLYELDLLVQAAGSEGVKSVGVVNASLLGEEEDARRLHDLSALSDDKFKVWDSWPGGWRGSWGMTLDGTLFAEGKRVRSIDPEHKLDIRPDDILTVVVNTDEGDPVLLSTGAIDIRANFGYVTLSFKLNGAAIPGCTLSNVPSPINFAAGADSAPFQLMVHRFRSRSTAAIQEAQRLAADAQESVQQQRLQAAVDLYAQAMAVAKGGGETGAEYAEELRDGAERAQENLKFEQQVTKGDDLVTQARAAMEAEDFYDASEMIREARECFQRGGSVGAIKVRELRHLLQDSVNQRLPRRFPL